MEKLWFGLQVAVLGMGIVFVVLIVLSYLTTLLSKVSQGKKERAVKKGEIEGVGWEKMNTEQVSVGKSSQVIAGGKEMTGEVVAVITAAVYESLGSKRYKLTAVRELPREQAPVWAQAGRMEQLKSLLS